MDERDIIKRIKNSFKSGMSRSEVTRKLQKKDYKLEYIDALIGKSRPKKFIMSFSVVIVLVLLFATIFIAPFLYSKTKPFLNNPLTGNVVFSTESSANNQNLIPIEDVEITPEFISYLLVEIGAWRLRKNYVTREIPKISFDVSGKQFYSKVGNNIESFIGSKEDTDMKIIMPKIELLMAFSSGNPQDYMKKSIEEGKTRIEIYSSEADLYAKGYLSIYNSLKTN